MKKYLTTYFPELLVFILKTLVYNYPCKFKIGIGYQ